MASKVFHKFYSVVLLFFPKFDVPILAGCDDKVCPETDRETGSRQSANL